MPNAQHPEVKAGEAKLGFHRLCWLTHLDGFGPDYWPDSTRQEHAQVAVYLERHGLTEYLDDGVWCITDAGHVALLRATGASS